MDDQYYYDLAYARSKQKEISEFESAANQNVRPPSKTKYGLLFTLAGFADIVDLAELTGFGLILVWIVKIVVSPILFMAGFGANKRVKTMNQFQESTSENIAHLTRQAQTYAKRYAMAVRLSRKTGILKKPVRQMALKVAKTRKAILRSPALKNGLAVIADLIPLIDLLPWRTVGVYMAYRDEKRTYFETQEVIPDYYDAKATEIQAANDLREAELAEETT